MVSILNYKMIHYLYIVKCGTIGFLDPENTGIDPKINGLAGSGAEILINEVYGGGHFEKMAAIAYTGQFLRGSISNIDQH